MLILQTGDVIAYADDESNMVVIWNGSATFNVYADGTESDVFTHYGVVTISDGGERRSGLAQRSACLTTS